MTSLERNGATARVSVQREKGKIWSHIRKKWIIETPEETVRQDYLCILVNEYGSPHGTSDAVVHAPGSKAKARSASL